MLEESPSLYRVDAWLLKQLYVKTSRILLIALAFFAAMFTCGSVTQAQTNFVNVTNIGISCVGLTVSGNYLYACEYSSSLRIYDISNPSNPIDVGYDGPAPSTGVAVSGDYAYVISGKVAVVTGGSRGIGAAIAKLLKDNVALTLEARYLHLSCVASTRPISV